MEIYLSHVSFGAPHRHSPAELIERAVELDFSGVALSDRSLAGLADSDAERLREIARKRACGIVLDINADLTLADSDEAGSEIDHVVAMIDLAARLGAGRVRLAVGGQSFGIQRLLRRRRVGSASSPGVLKRFLTSRPVIRAAHHLRTSLPARPAPEERLGRCVHALRVILPHAERSGVRIGIENHWGITTRPEDVIEIVRRVESPYVGTCPDFANFPRSLDRYRGLAMLAPHAVLAHARSSSFDAHGEERTINYRRCLGILRSVGFDRVLCVEFLGGGDALIGARRTHDLVTHHLTDRLADRATNRRSQGGSSGAGSTQLISDLSQHDGDGENQ